MCDQYFNLLDRIKLFADQAVNKATNTHIHHSFQNLNLLIEMSKQPARKIKMKHQLLFEGANYMSWVRLNQWKLLAQFSLFTSVWNIVEEEKKNRYEMWSLCFSFSRYIVSPYNFILLCLHNVRTRIEQRSLNQPQHFDCVFISFRLPRTIFHN